VKKILRGYEREMTARFTAFRSHWRYEASFCTPGEGHEKGGVEGEVGYFRRNHWVPVPAARDLAEVNAKLFADCRQDENRVLAGRAESVGALLLAEKEHLLPLPPEDFYLAEVGFPRVNQSGCAKVRTNFYSVPLKPGTVVEARVHSSAVEFHHGGARVARHERSYDRARQILEPLACRRPDLPQRSRQPICQWPLHGPSRRPWKEGLDEWQGQLLGQRLFGDAVRLAEGRAAARHGVQKPQGGEGRDARLAALVQRIEDALVVALSQPGTVRATSTHRTTRPRSLTAKAQPQPDESPKPVRL